MLRVSVIILGAVNGVKKKERMQFFYVDASVSATDPSKVWLWGKVRTPEGQFASCCCLCAGVERVLFLRPRSPEHWAATKAAAVEACRLQGGFTARTRVVESMRRACTGPRHYETFVELRYIHPRSNSHAVSVRLVAGPATPFDVVVATEDSPLETFLLERGLAGPCWLQLNEARFLPADALSSCSVNVTLDHPRLLQAVTLPVPPDPPPLRALYLHASFLDDPASSTTTKPLPGKKQTAVPLHCHLQCISLLCREVACTGNTTTRSADRLWHLSLGKPTTTTTATSSIRWHADRDALYLDLANLLAEQDPDILVGYNLIAHQFPRLLREAALVGSRQMHPGFLGRLLPRAGPPPFNTRNGSLERVQPRSLQCTGRLVFDLRNLHRMYGGGARAPRTDSLQEMLEAQFLQPTADFFPSSTAQRKEKVREGKEGGEESEESEEGEENSAHLSLESLRAPVVQKLENFLLPSAANSAEHRWEVYATAIRESRAHLDLTQSELQTLLLASTSSEDVSQLYLQNHSNACFGLVRLLEELGSLEFTLQVTQCCGNTWSENLWEGSAANRMEFLLAHRMTQKRFLVERRQQPSSSSSPSGAAKSYRGGTVLEAVTGPHAAYSALLDIAATYPSIIVARKLCFTRLSATDREDYSLHELVLPDLVNEFMVRRSDCRAALEQPQQRSLAVRQLRAQEKALKLLTNQIYGLLGSAHFRFGNRDLAEAITAEGRRLLEAFRAHAVAQQFRVLYGHTDSILVHRSDFGSLQAAQQAFVQLQQELNDLSPGIRVKIDAVFDFLLVLSKTQYIGSLAATSSPAAACLLIKGCTVTDRRTPRLAQDIALAWLAQCLAPHLHTPPPSPEQLQELLLSAATSLHSELQSFLARTAAMQPPSLFRWLHLLAETTRSSKPLSEYAAAVRPRSLFTAAAIQPSTDIAAWMQRYGHVRTCFSTVPVLGGVGGDVLVEQALRSASTAIHWSHFIARALLPTVEKTLASFFTTTTTTTPSKEWMQKLATLFGLEKHAPSSNSSSSSSSSVSTDGARIIAKRSRESYGLWMDQERSAWEAGAKKAQRCAPWSPALFGAILHSLSEANSAPPSIALGVCRACETAPLATRTWTPLVETARRETENEAAAEFLPTAQNMLLSPRFMPPCCAACGCELKAPADLEHALRSAAAVAAAAGQERNPLHGHWILRLHTEAELRMKNAPVDQCRLLLQQADAFQPAFRHARHLYESQQWH
jgi:DNA polymerase elongation subunit (family B)